MEDGQEPDGATPRRADKELTAESRDGAAEPDRDDHGGDGDGEEHPSHLRAGLIYGGMILGGLLLLLLVLKLGQDVKGPKIKGGGGQGGSDAEKIEKIIWHLLLASVAIILVARAVGQLFQRIHQPQVVGEIVAGVLLGPSVLGNIWPGAKTFLFPHEVLPHIEVLAQVGLIFYMFLIGLELDPKLMRGRGHTAATVSHVSIIVPFLMGAGAALVLFPMIGSQKGDFVPFALFLGASMSITAFPVLARILVERGIYKTHLGVVTLTCAAVDDVTAWCVLAVVITIAKASGPADALVTIGLSVVYIVFMLKMVRPFLSRIAGYHEERGHLAGGMLALLFVGILLSALATDRIGIHAIFGAFLFGAIMPKRSEFIGEMTQKLEDFTVVYLVPLFFAFTGLRTDIGLLGTKLDLWLALGLVLVVAIAGKWGGSTLAARALKVPWRESMALGVLMNTRGLTELIILNIGLDLKVIPPPLFAILVVMALVTTFMTTPILSLLYPRHVVEQMVAEAGEGEARDGEAGEARGARAERRRYTVLVPVPKAQQAVPLVHAAISLAKESDEHGRVILLRAVQPPGSAYRAGPEIQESLMAGAAQSLKPLVQLVQGAGQEAVPLVVPAGDTADAIVEVAEERNPDVVLLSYHRPLWGRNILGGTVGEVLKRAPADVAVLVDPTGEAFTLKRDDRIVVPHGGGYHEDVGLDLALRLGRASGATVSLLGPGGDEKEARELASRASRAVEESGVWTLPESVESEPLPVLLEHVRQADLVVLGVGDEWFHNKESLGGLREAVAASTPVPILLVRRHGKKSRLRRPREWIAAGGVADAASASTDDASTPTVTTRS